MTERVAIRLYRLFLYAYPARFRREYGADATRDFTDIVRDARARGDGRAVLAVCLRAALRVPADGLRERATIVRRRALPRPPVSPRSSVMERLANDVRLALRSLIKRPGFTLTTIAILGLGIGATTTIYSVVDRVMFRPLPYPASERLVLLTKETSAVPVPDYVAWRDRATSFDAVAAAWDQAVDLTGDGQPERLEAALVSDNLFAVLGARAVHGRLLQVADFGAGAPPAAVLAFDFWLRRWGGDPSIVGRSITLDGQPVEVVGILGPSYVAPEALELDDVSLYVALDEAAAALQTRTLMILAVVGRLGPGVALETARAELDVLERALAEEAAENMRDGRPIRIEMARLDAATVGDIGRTLYMFLGAVGLMLLIACANVANLLLARGTDRHHEMAVRRALGAGRVRIATQLLTESMALGVAGGMVGAGLAYLGVAAFRVLDPGGVPRMAEVALDLRILAFAFALSLSTGVIFGIVPAFASARADPQAAIREGSLAVTAGRRRARLRGATVVTEMALALILLIGAGLLLRSFVKLTQVETGFEPNAVTTLRLDIEARRTGQDRVAFAHELLARVADLPGVDAAGASWQLPFDRGRCCWRSSAWAAGRTDTIGPYLHPVTPGYFRALGVPLLRGRSFRDADELIGTVPPSGADERPTVAGAVPTIVSRSTAERLWPGLDPIGEVIEVVSLRRAGLHLRVVGVVADIRHWRLDADGGDGVYVPFSPFAAWIGLLDVAVRYRGPEEPVAAALRMLVRDMDRDLPLGAIASMEHRIAASVATPRFYALLLTSFAVVAFLLAAGGIYGSMLYTVGQRQREMGIRIALGARGASLMGLVLGRGMVQAALGIVLGLAAGALMARTLESLVFGVTATDPLTYVAAALGLGAAALAACAVPALRAARTDPVETLRVE